MHRGFVWWKKSAHETVVMATEDFVFVSFCFICIKVRFLSVSLDKSGSTTERNDPQMLSDRAQSLHSF